MWAKGQAVRRRVALWGEGSRCETKGHVVLKKKMKRSIYRERLGLRGTCANGSYQTDGSQERGGEGSA